MIVVNFIRIERMSLYGDEWGKMSQRFEIKSFFFFFLGVDNHV